MNVFRVMVLSWIAGIFMGIIGFGVAYYKDFIALEEVDAFVAEATKRSNGKINNRAIRSYNEAMNISYERLGGSFDLRNLVKVSKLYRDQKNYNKEMTALTAAFVGGVAHHRGRKIGNGTLVCQEILDAATYSKTRMQELSDQQIVPLFASYKQLVYQERQTYDAKKEQDSLRYVSELKVIAVVFAFIIALVANSLRMKFKKIKNRELGSQKILIAKVQTHIKNVQGNQRFGQSNTEANSNSNGVKVA